VLRYTTLDPPTACEAPRHTNSYATPRPRTCYPCRSTPSPTMPRVRGLNSEPTPSPRSGVPLFTRHISLRHQRPRACAHQNVLALHYRASLFCFHNLVSFLLRRRRPFSFAVSRSFLALALNVFIIRNVLVIALHVGFHSVFLFLLLRHTLTDTIHCIHPSHDTHHHARTSRIYIHTYFIGLYY